MIKLFFTAILVGVCLLVKAQKQPLAVRDSLTVKEYFFAALKEKLNENYVRANANFSKVVAIDPNNDAAYFEMANLSLQQNKLLDAEMSIKRALAINPHQVWYLKLQTEIYKRTGNMEALVQTFDQLIAKAPEVESYYFDRANAFFIAGEIEKSIIAYDALEEKFGVSNASIAAKLRFKQNYKHPESTDLQKLIGDYPKEVKNYLHLSGILLAQKKNEEALALLLKAKTIEEDNYEVNLALADVYDALKKNDEAVAVLKLAFESIEMPLPAKIKILNQLLLKFNKPSVVKATTELGAITLATYKDDAKVILLYGDILYQQGNLKGAVAQYLAAIKKEEQLYIAWEKLLGVQTLMGNYEAAIKTAEEALGIYPNQAILYYYSAFALHRNGQNAAAGLEIKYALQLAEEDDHLKAMVLGLQAEVMIDQGKLKEADAVFDKAVALAPNNYLTMSNYAYYLALRNHDLNKAEKLAYKAVSGMPKDASILDTYAIVLFKLNRFQEALTYIEKALQTNERENPVYLEHYGDILFLKGDKENAVLQWRNAKNAGNQSGKLMRKINEKKYIK